MVRYGVKFCLHHRVLYRMDRELLKATVVVHLWHLSRLIVKSSGASSSDSQTFAAATGISVCNKPGTYCVNCRCGTGSIVGHWGKVVLMVGPQKDEIRYLE